MNKHFMFWLVFFISTMVLFVLPAAQSSSYTTITGKIGPGAFYEIAMPTTEWNGELVVYAHGITGPNDPIALLDDLGPWRDTLTSQGFAVIYSSYSQNSYAVKDGMQRTHQLRGIFKSKIGRPTRVYLVGTSLGGLIVVMLAERYPGQYDGAVSDGGLVGGGAFETKCLVDTRILFDYFFPGVIPGTVWDVPPGLDSGSAVSDIIDALLQGLGTGATQEFFTAAKLPGNDLGELITAAVYEIVFLLDFGPSVMEITGGISYDNTKTAYSGSSDDTALNAGVGRFPGDLNAVNYLQRYYTPTGGLHIPVITLHATRDPISPILHEQIYADAVADAGASQYLLQRTSDVFGHTGATDADYEAAFFSLVEWVHTGVKPLN